jgi:Arc/MetJ-type ribon-helix-helix transcriptional regulator
VTFEGQIDLSFVFGVPRAPILAEVLQAEPGALDTKFPLWYVDGMTKKIAISLPDESLEKARTAVRQGKAPNVSNYIARLIEEASASETFEEMIAAWIRESGASEAQIRAAEDESQRAFARAGLVRKGARRAAPSRKAS